MGLGTLRFIEHFSPYCGHCRRFAPTWELLVEHYTSQEDPGVQLAQVNCAIHGGQCVCHRREVLSHSCGQISVEKMAWMAIHK